MIIRDFYAVCGKWQPRKQALFNTRFECSQEKKVLKTKNDSYTEFAQASLTEIILSQKSSLGHNTRFQPTFTSKLNQLFIANLFYASFKATFKNSLVIHEGNTKQISTRQRVYYKYRKSLHPLLSML